MQDSDKDALLNSELEICLPIHECAQAYGGEIMPSSTWKLAEVKALSSWNFPSTLSNNVFFQALLRWRRLIFQKKWLSEWSYWFWWNSQDGNLWECVAMCMETAHKLLWCGHFFLFVEADHSWRSFFLLIVRCFFGPWVSISWWSRDAYVHDDAYVQPCDFLTMKWELLGVISLQQR